VSALREALPYVLYHHERWDGAGYPSGKAGEEIPLEARLLAIADAFDAMTSDRPYRRALTYEQTLAEIKRCAGTQFDPKLALVFLELFETKLAAAAAL
jgi:HD-GYP domain-containing protein (c-di-GMP phosphodiesterase class II)